MPGATCSDQRRTKATHPYLGFVNYRLMMTMCCYELDRLLVAVVGGHVDEFNGRNSIDPEP